MKNWEISNILNETAELLEFEGADFFKIRAYREAAVTVLRLNGDIESLKEEDKLSQLPRIGKGMAQRIKQYIEEGDFEEHQRLISEIPPGVLSMLKVPGLGSKKAKLLYEKLGIDSLAVLEEKASQGALRSLEGFGEKTEEKILAGVQKVKQYSKRFLLNEADFITGLIEKRLKKIKGVKKVLAAGPVRRRAETVDRIDILYTSSRPGIETGREFAGGLQEKDIKSVTEDCLSFKWRGKCAVDVRKIEESRRGSALQYYTGSKEHFNEIKKAAENRGFKVDRFGIVTGKSSSEKEIYRVLGMQYIPPELRENMGEVKAALEGSLPELVKEDDILGDTHIHSVYSDGLSSIEETAGLAYKLGYEWIAVCDHSRSLTIAGGLEIEELEKKIEEIRILNKKSPVKILAGQEVDILKDGSLDYPDNVLKKLDIVVASIHTGFSDSEDAITGRITDAMNNPYVNIVAHPTGRLLNEREPYKVNISRVIKAAAETGTSLEINAHPKRLDLSYRWVKEANENGVKLAIATDAHHLSEMGNMKYGVSVARRGWLEKEDVLNTMDVKKLLEYLKSGRKVNK